MSTIVVIGSANTDMVVKAPRIPRPGETILGGRFLMNPGGKGANQAVAAARMGARVGFVTRVGDDIFGRQAIENFEAEGIDTTFVSVDADNPSGVALAVAISENKSFPEAVTFANKVASISVTRMGAQSSVPYRMEVVLN